VLERGGVGTGILTPIELLVREGDPDEVARAAGSVPGIATALAPSDPAWRQDGTALVTVVPNAETVDQTSSELIDAVKTAAADVGSVQTTGAGQLVDDYISAVYSSFPIVLAVIIVLTYVLLARAFRSLLLPLKAVLLNLLSLSATFGATVLFWQSGYGSEAVFGVAPTGAITFWLPIMIFAFLFGLSMDYEVFILARMREEYDATGSTATAVITGIGRTGRLVTSAALILFFAFAALASAPGTDIKVLGTALGVGILIDATLVRALLVPATVSVLGRWNWWLPVWLARLLRVEPSPLTPPEPPALPTQRTQAQRELDAPGSRRL
jgi:RND superfamily putative drug exporter